MAIPPRNMDDNYTLEEIKAALENSKGFFMAHDAIKSVYEMMEADGLKTVPKSELSESEYELLDWALPVEGYSGAINKENRE